MHTVRVPIGSLAAKYYKSWRAYREIEEQLESLIVELYASNRFEVGPDGIDIYEAVASPAAAACLFRSGWRSVRVHDHKQDRFLKCGCAIERDLLEGS
jgi:hypothetical protein